MPCSVSVYINCLCDLSVTHVGIPQEERAEGFGTHVPGCFPRAAGSQGALSCRGLVTLVETIVQAPQASWVASTDSRARWLPDHQEPASSKARTSFSPGHLQPQSSSWACRGGATDGKKQ